MNKRRKIILGMFAGALWALAIVWGAQPEGFTFMPPQIAMPGALIAPGLVMAVMIGRLAARRFFDDDIIDGATFEPGSAAWIDQRVLANTVEQSVLAVLVWPFVALTLGGQVVLAMGFAFAAARLAFWIGYHVSPPLRAFGFAATFYTTVLAGVWSVVVWV